jgi:hypothetical protein
MTDKELPELAAKAAGIELQQWVESRNTFFLDPYQQHWNPLTDDGDALRLAVKLHLDVTMYPVTNEVGAIQHKHDGICYGTVNRCFERTGTYPYAATRRAIVRAAAAEIRAQMK